MISRVSYAKWPACLLEIVHAAGSVILRCRLLHSLLLHILRRGHFVRDGEKSGAPAAPRLACPDCITLPSNTEMLHELRGGWLPLRAKSS
ncbi:hypothetical protein FQA47_010205 [Oryzias melastigma]|uniref:Uncharacterized protein n=1 Tax=Oryzias melastigma TaxID=30732 RepID=A0A834FI20_ORYME|nr:hypothetical protein FQA47_010205 [Oryzias melastigma]